MKMIATVLEKFGKFFGENWLVALILTTLTVYCLITGLVKGDAEFFLWAVVFALALFFGAVAEHFSKAFDRWLAEKEKNADHTSAQSEQ